MGSNIKPSYRRKKLYFEYRNCYTSREVNDMCEKKYDADTGLPEDKDYLECSLPEYLVCSINNMKRTWDIIDAGERDPLWDVSWCDLAADINCAEVDQEISSEQAWYLREKYLRIIKEEF